MLRRCTRCKEIVGMYPWREPAHCRACRDPNDTVCQDRPLSIMEQNARRKADALANSTGTLL